MVNKYGAMESLAMMHFSQIYEGKRVLITGHTGFKGSWLALWLQTLGAEVTGISLAPTSTPNHWDLLRLDMSSFYLDIRDSAALQKALYKTKPEMIFHLAAQPLVRQSYRNPLETWSTNVMGTANLLDACRSLSELRAVVVVTTDKVYKNCEWEWGYRENDRLGGHDPYSASKAASELVVDSYRKSFFDKGMPLLATARAGNVIGGGDWSEDRLIPDLVRAIQQKTILSIRSPLATRPWQHVLECLSGYLLLGQKLLEGKGIFADGWNFGPKLEDNRTVSGVLCILQKYWPDLAWEEVRRDFQPHEANLLYLDSAKAKSHLDWRSVWSLEEALSATAEWYRDYINRNKVISSRQLHDFMTAGYQRGCK